MTTLAKGSEGLSDIGAAEANVVGAASIDLTPWGERIERSIAISKKVRGGNFVQIATVDSDGKPRCRTVVFRGFQGFEERGGAKALKMITDARSEKVGHVAASPACEMVWWFSKSSEQYRIAGDLEIVGPSHASKELVAARKQQWGNLSDNAREQFYWEGQPGAPHATATGPPPPTGGRGSDGAVLPVPDTFLLVLLWPHQVKYLRLTDNFSQLDTASACEEGGDRAWKTAQVNP